MVTRSPQLNLDELRRLKWLLGLAMALVSLWTVFFLDIEALGLVGVVGGLIAAALVWPQLPGRIPPWAWKLAVPAIMIGTAFDFYSSPDTLPVLIRLAILLVLYRAVNYRRKREDLQLIVLGMFLIVVAGVLTVALGFAFLLLLFTACALGFLFVINLVDAAESAAPRGPAGEAAWARLAWRDFFGRLRAVLDWRLLGFAAGLFVTVVLMSSLLFVLIPRFEFASGFFLDKYITRKTRTGFTDTIRFGDVAQLDRDNSVAMRVDVGDARSVHETPYWRLVVLDEYTKEGFKVSDGLKAELQFSQHVQQTVGGELMRDRGRFSVGGVWTFYVEPGVSRYFPLPGSFGVMRLGEFMPVQVNLPHRIVAMRTESMTMTAFQLENVILGSAVTDSRFAVGLAAAQRRPADAVIRDAQDRLMADPRLELRGPAGEANQAVLQRIVREITHGAPLSAAEFAKAATEWLQARHAYALSVRLPAREGLDDVVRWLDSNEPGFCEYFAAAGTVLARAAGHPARVVAGFHGGALNAFENYFMVRNSDAHAWLEIFDDHGAWLRVDPTPGGAAATLESAVAAVAQRQDDSWSARFDSLRVLWYRRVVNFDSRAQMQMLATAKNLTTDSGQALRSWSEEINKRLRAWLTAPWSTRRIVRTAAVVVGVGAAVWMLVMVARRGWTRWRVWRRPDEFDPVRQAAGRWLARLREADPAGPRPPDGPLVDDLQRLRYGRRETWPEPDGVFRRARKKRREMGKRAPSTPTSKLHQTAGNFLSKK